MIKLCKKWKFWNKDIRKAYKSYYGLKLMPYKLVYDESILYNDPSIDLEKYADKTINPKYYSKIKY